jgi:hypothetical protein
MGRNLGIEEVDKFHQALLDAFPSHGELRRLLFHRLGLHLDRIAGGQNDNEVVTNLIIWAEANGETENLLKAARAQNPGNPKLYSFEQEYKQLRAVLPAEGSTSFTGPNSGKDTGPQRTVLDEIADLQNRKRVLARKIIDAIDKRSQSPASALPALDLEIASYKRELRDVENTLDAMRP